MSTMQFGRRQKMSRGQNYSGMVSWAPILLALSLSPCNAANASEPASNETIQSLREELSAMRRQQQSISARIEQIEAVLDQSPPEAKPSETQSPVVVQEDAEASAKPRPSVTEPQEKLQFSGDLRLRYEGNFSEAASDRNRAVIRGRLRATYQLNDWLMIGGRVGTGNPDDPNSDDVTLSNFVDDLSISLDELYASARFSDFVAYGGKFALPFKKTDLVWDGDVSPQGAGVKYSSNLGGAVIDAAGLFYVIDESVAGPDSTMKGVQLGIHNDSAALIGFDAAAAYYDYSLRNLTGADAGDFRGNLLTTDGAYLSDFNLLDVIVGLSYRGLGSHWPIQISADYVKNLGSYTSEDSGFAIDFAIGSTAQIHDSRIRYQYMQAEVDAVMAAFSHDNLALSTNYEQHALVLDYVLDRRVSLNATYYRYRSLESEYLNIVDHGEWLNRLRLNAIFSF